MDPEPDNATLDSAPSQAALDAFDEGARAYLANEIPAAVAQLARAAESGSPSFPASRLRPTEKLWIK